MAVTTQTPSAPAPGWLRNPVFDLSLIWGLTLLSLAAGFAIAAEPLMIGPILLADFWLLGCPHVAATFTRMAPDKNGFLGHRFLIFGLPVIVIAATATLALSFGIVLVATIYFYWQWFHTLRQSWGIAQLYRRRSAVPVRESAFAGEALFTLVALWGLLHRLTTAPDYFLFPVFQISVPQVPVWLADTVGAFAVAGLLWWAYERVRDYIDGQLPLAHTLFSLSHYVIFIFGYVLLDNVAGGWIVTNIWHTSQYMMLVWLFNENAKPKIAPAAWYARITKGNRVILFFAVCALAPFPLYFTINQMFGWGAAGIMAAVIINQTMNFHHFLVDSVIWRARRKPVGAPS